MALDAKFYRRYKEIHFTYNEIIDRAYGERNEYSDFVKENNLVMYEGKEAFDNGAGYLVLEANESAKKFIKEKYGFIIYSVNDLTRQKLENEISKIKQDLVQLGESEELFAYLAEDIERRERWERWEKEAELKKRGKEGQD